MSFSAGDKLGPYEILAPIGAGGMGSVYRAHDSRLRRDVALKVSQERFSERFEREARAVASLNHPNICALYDVGPNYLVMELIEGKSPKGPLPLATVLTYARQIAAALEAAHDKGIVHRDLKPANIIVRADGTVKLLDFGLAKALAKASDEPSPVDADSLLSTQTVPMTEAGVIMGTAAYMSPEQAQGLPVDKRTDIWAFGVVLYELLVGKRPFRGATITDTLASVLKEEPDWDLIPAPAQRLLRRCLTKDPTRRLRDIGDAMDLVDDQASLAGPARRSRWTISLAAAGALIAAVALAIVADRWLSPPPQEETWSGSVLSGPETAFDPRISPDGRLLAFQAMENGQTQIAVMTPESGNWSVITHSRELGGPTELAWSRDATSIYYDRVADSPKGIFSVPVLGGEEKLVLENAMSPEVLPDGTLLIYRLNAQRNLQLNRYWPETGRLQELPVICRTDIGTLWVHIRTSPDGKEAVVVGTPLGKDQEPDRLLAVDVSSGISRPLTPPGMKLEGNAAAVTRDGKSVVLAIREDALNRVISIPLKGSAKGPAPSEFAPRTLFTATVEIWYLDTGPGNKIYLNTVVGPGTVARIPASGDRGTILGVLPDDSSDSITSLPDGRALVSFRGLGRDRIMAMAENKNPVPLIATAEETSPPMTAAGPHGVAFMIGAPPHLTIAVADTVSGRVTGRITPGKGEIASLASSPDGQILYFSSDRKIWSIPAAGGEPALIRTGNSVVADPDGRSLVVATVESAKTRLFRVPLGGGKEHEISTDGSVPLGPVALSAGALRADGRLAVSLFPFDSWYAEPGILDTKTGRITRVHSDQVTSAAGISWTFDGQILGLSRHALTGLWQFQPLVK